MSITKSCQWDGNNIQLRETQWFSVTHNSPIAVYNSQLMINSAFRKHEEPNQVTRIKKKKKKEKRNSFNSFNRFFFFIPISTATFVRIENVSLATHE